MFLSVFLHTTIRARISFPILIFNLSVNPLLLPLPFVPSLPSSAWGVRLSSWTEPLGSASTRTPSGDAQCGATDGYGGGSRGNRLLSSLVTREEEEVRAD